MWRARSARGCRRGLADWNDKLGVASSPLHRSGGVSTPPSLTGGAAQRSLRELPLAAALREEAALLHRGLRPSDQRQPPIECGWDRKRLQWQHRVRTVAVHNPSGAKSETETDRLDGTPASTCTPPGQRHHFQPGSTCAVPTAPVWRTGNVSGGDEMTVTNEPPEDTASPGESEESNAEYNSNFQEQRARRHRYQGGAFLCLPQ